PLPARIDLLGEVGEQEEEVRQRGVLGLEACRGGFQVAKGRYVAIRSNGAARGPRSSAHPSQEPAKEEGPQDAAAPSPWRHPAEGRQSRADGIHLVPTPRRTSWKEA